MSLCGAQVYGHRYFLCRANHGIFLRPFVVEVVEKGVDALLPATDARATAAVASSSNVGNGHSQYAKSVAPLSQAAGSVVTSEVSAVSVSARDRMQEIERRMVKSLESDLQSIAERSMGACDVM